MKIRELIDNDSRILVAGDPETEITGIAYDTRKIKPGNLFVCIVGTVSDGHKYIDQAIALGASAIAVTKEVTVAPEIAVIRMKDDRAALSDMSTIWFGHPADKLITIGLTGTKEGCGEGECGACSCLIDGNLSNSCLVALGSVAGKSVVTLEGFRDTEQYRLLERTFADAGAVQCGFCTPGFIMTAVEILESGKEYTDDELRKLLSGHLCRCTGYENILRAVKKTMYKRLGKEMTSAV